MPSAAGAKNEHTRVHARLYACQRTCLDVRISTWLHSCHRELTHERIPTAGPMVPVTVVCLNGTMQVRKNNAYASHI